MGVNESGDHTEETASPKTRVCTKLSFRLGP